MPETILLVGASRGLGHALAAEFAARGWHVIGTVRGEERTLLHDLRDAHPDDVEVERVDINEPDQVAALRARLEGRSLDALFVNAGATRATESAIGDVSTADFDEVMHTNALSPMRVIEALQDLVPDDGLIGAMSSGQGSLTNNTRGMRELYRGSKAALNMFLRSFAARQADTSRAFVLTAPGWIKTELGGPDAPLTIEETIPRLTDVLLAKRSRPGIEYLDYTGATVPW